MPPSPFDDLYELPSRPVQHEPRSKGPWIHGPRLTERDVDILRWITRHGVVTTDLVGRRFFWRDDRSAYGEWAAYRRLAALSRLGLIVRDVNPYATRGSRRQILRASRDGARIADVGLAQAPLVISELPHTLALVGLTEFLLARYPEAELITERELRAETYRLRYSGNATPLEHVPDALLRIPNPDGSGTVVTVAVELDLSRKDRRAMEEMITRYDRMLSVDVVWWYVKEIRLQRVRGLVAGLRAESRYKVLPVR